MDQMLALALLITILFIGEAVSIRTKAWIPSVFISATLFIIGYWTFFPKDIVEIAGIPPVVATMMIYILITHMGTLLSVKELKSQWKTILIAIAGVAGAAVLLLTVGVIFFGKEAMIVGVPPLVGGVVSSLIMSEGAQAVGLTSLSVFAVVIYVVQGFISYPLTSIMLKKEGRNYLRKYRNGEITIKKDNKVTKDTQKPKLKLFEKSPEKYNTNFFKLFRLIIVAYLAYLELHIEQGPILEQENKTIGIVNKIVGLTQLEVTVKGIAGHAGTTPMDHRSDALITAANIVTELPALAIEERNGTVITTGKFNVYPNGANVISDKVVFTIDLRSREEESIHRVIKKAETLIDSYQKENIETYVSQQFFIKPKALSEEIRSLFKETTEELKISSIPMLSGAGHDAMVFSDYTEAGMIFIPSKDGLSHCPEEWSDIEHLSQGVDILFETAKQLTSND